MNYGKPGSYMKKFCALIICSVALLILAGCSSTMEKRSQQLQLGMDRKSCVDIIDTDYAVVASRLEADGSPVAVMKFHKKKQPDLYLYFRNNKLVQWGDVDVLKAMPPAVHQ